MPLFQKGQPRPPNAGRKKGTPNKATVQRRMAEAAGVAEQLKAIKSQEMPLDFLLRKMRDPTSSPADQFTAALAAAHLAGSVCLLHCYTPPKQPPCRNAANPHRRATLLPASTRLERRCRKKLVAVSIESNERVAAHEHLPKEGVVSDRTLTGHPVQ